MKHLEFVPPNYLCKIADEDGRVTEMYLRADSEADLREKAGELPVQLIAFWPYDFSEWEERAEREARRVNVDYSRKDLEFDRRLWGELKQYLFFLSRGTCGYCEERVRSSSPGDVEHYRPKRRVEEDPEHPGYYWLAYDALNYVPCCENCNRYRGKLNHFPLASGCHRATGPEGIGGERPLLLNPFHEAEPFLHFHFIGSELDRRCGILEGATPEGEMSRKIYNLNRPDLVKARRDAYLDLCLQLELAEVKPIALEKIVEGIRNGNQPFSMMRRLVLLEWLESRKRREQERYDATMRSLDDDLWMLQSRALTATRATRGSEASRSTP